MTPRLTAEVIVCGAGPVGSALAGLIAAGGVQCLLVDARPAGQAPNPAGKDPRALALTPASRAILESFDLWRRLPPACIGRFERMQVWDEGGQGHIGFDCTDLCAPVLGYIVPQTELQQALDERLAALPGVSVLRGSDPAGIDWHEDHVALRLADGTSLVARLVVAADGHKSRLRETAGIGFPVRAYGQDAVACLVRTELPHGNVARQRFLRSGPLAFLPLAEPDRCGVVWSTTPEHARALQDMKAPEFRAALAAAFENMLGQVLESGPRKSFPLSTAHADRYVRGRLVLAGDAAHCVHPLAGQGANLGLLDAAALAELVVDAHRRGRDPGAARVLRAYERWRRGENAVMGFALDALQKLFEPADGPLPGLRNLGLDLVDRSGPFKHAIMRRAMGIDGDVPRIARGMTGGGQARA